MRRTKVILICLVFILGHKAFSQSFYQAKRDRAFLASIGTGISSYFGELNSPRNKLPDNKLNIEVGLKYMFSPRFGARLTMMWFRLQGDDATSKYEPIIERNLSFRSDNIEIGLVGIAQLIPEGSRFYQRPRINPYAFGGIGYMYFQPKAKAPQEYMGTPLPEAGKWVALRPLETEGVAYKRSTLVIPFGLGINIRVTPWLNAVIEGGYRLTFTDYLDDVSTVHKDPASFTDPLAAALADRRPELGLSQAKAGHIRGNPNKNDGYFILNAKVEYFLPPEFLQNIIHPDKLRTVKVKRSRRRR